MSWWALFNGSVFSRRAVTKQATLKNKSKMLSPIMPQVVPLPEDVFAATTRVPHREQTGHEHGAMLMS